jgi:hypothetical protein
MRIVDMLVSLFWAGAASLVAIGLVVALLRVAKNKVPATAGVANTVGNVTGLNI